MPTLSPRPRRALGRLLIAAALCLPLAAPAQGPPPAPGAMPGMPAGGPPPEMMEAMQLQGKLRGAIDKALADPDVAVQRKQMMDTVQAAMAAKDPAAKDKIAKLEALSKQAEAFSKANDQAGLQGLMAEGRALAEGLQGLERQVLEDAAIKSKAQAFDAMVKAKVRTIEPQFDAMEKRMADLAAKLQRGPGGPPGGGGMRMPPPGPPPAKP